MRRAIPCAGARGHGFFSAGTGGARGGLRETKSPAQRSRGPPRGAVASLTYTDQRPAAERSGEAGDAPRVAARGAGCSRAGEMSGRRGRNGMAAREYCQNGGWETREGGTEESGRFPGGVSRIPRGDAGRAARSGRRAFFWGGNADGVWPMGPNWGEAFRLIAETG